MKQWIQYRMEEVAIKSYNIMPWNWRYDDWLCSMSTRLITEQGAMDIVDDVATEFEVLRGYTK